MNDLVIPLDNGYWQIQVTGLEGLESTFHSYSPVSLKCSLFFSSSTQISCQDISCYSTSILLAFIKTEGRV